MSTADAMLPLARAGLGLVLLAAGAELLVRGASRLARAVGLSPLVVGLTVVAYGTSAPELAVSMKAGLAGRPEIAVGNVVGSNVFNVLLILGVSALVIPLTAPSQLVRFDVPVMICVSALAWLLAADGVVGRAEGAVLVAGIVLYTLLLVRAGRKKEGTPSGPEVTKQDRPRGGRSIATSLILVLPGLLLLVLGARWLVSGATGLARELGVSELMIGLTLVAAGTSLPELATSVVAAARGERDIAVGNIVGSNVFNILAVLGGTAVAAGRVEVAPAVIHFDMPVMAAVALACLPILFTGGRISRWEGALFVAYYVTYVSYLALAASQHEAMGTFGSVVLWFFVPATVLGIGVSLAHAWRVRRRSRDSRPGV